jgi:hypothetical protein
LEIKRKKGTAIDFHVPTGGSISAKTVGIFAAIDMSVVDGATTVPRTPINRRDDESA